MVGNGEYLRGPVGAGKLFTIILGLVSVILSWHAYYWSCFNFVIRYDALWYIDNLAEEQAFMYSTLILLVLSIIYLIFSVVRDPTTVGQGAKVADFVFHLIGMVALLIVGSLLIYSTVYIEWYKCIQVESYLIHEQILQWFLGARCQLYEEKMAAGVIAILNGILYGITGVLAISTSSLY